MHGLDKLGRFNFDIVIVKPPMDIKDWSEAGPHRSRRERLQVETSEGDRAVGVGPFEGARRANLRSPRSVFIGKKGHFPIDDLEEPAVVPPTLASPRSNSELSVHNMARNSPKGPEQHDPASAVGGAELTVQACSLDHLVLCIEVSLANDRRRRPDCRSSAGCTCHR